MHSVSLPRLNTPPPQPPELHITIVVGAAIVAQTAFALIWAGSATERLHQLERRADAAETMVERTTRLEEQVRHVADAVSRIEAKIDQQAESGR